MRVSLLSAAQERRRNKPTHFRSRMGYSTSCPGPWYVASPPRSVRCSSKGGEAGSKRRLASVLPVPSVYTGRCCSISSSSGGASPASSAASRRRSSAFCQSQARTYGTCGGGERTQRKPQRTRCAARARKARACWSCISYSVHGRREPRGAAGAAAAQHEGVACGRLRDLQRAGCGGRRASSAQSIDKSAAWRERETWKQARRSATRSRPHAP